MDMTKFFKETIIQKALKFKHAGHSIGIPSIVTDEEIANNDDIKKHFKNVCVQLPMDVNEHLEATLAILNLNKREFVILAIENALEEAERIMAEYNVFEYHSPSDKQ